MQTFRGLRDLGKLSWVQRAVIQAPERREAVIELCRISNPPAPGQDFVVRIGSVTTPPMTEADARQKFLVESSYVIKKNV